jgi:guanylate kinase
MEVHSQTPILQHHAEFAAILENYRPSDESVDIFRETPSVWLTGTSNSGRTTLIKRILATTDEYYQPISDTTRPRRRNNGVMEEDGENYWHITEPEMLEGLEQGKYLEAAIIHNRQVSGVNAEEISKIRDMGKTAIRDVEIAGIVKLHGYNPNAVYIMMLPPEFRTLLDRFHTRSDGEMSADEILDRIKSGIKEITIGLQCGFLQLMVSSDLDENVKLVHDRITGVITELPDQEEARQHAEQLLVDMQAYVDQTQAA